MIGLRAEDDVDMRRAAKDFGALGLRDAAAHCQHQPLAASAAVELARTQPAEFRVDLLRGLLANMAGVEDNHVGVVCGIDQPVPERRQEIGHPRRIIDIHLAAVRLDVKALIHAASLRFCHAHACAPAMASDDAAAGCGASALREGKTLASIGAWNSTLTVTMPRPSSVHRWGAISISPYQAKNGL